jgi:hypothetical protein
MAISFGSVSVERVAVCPDRERQYVEGVDTKVNVPSWILRPISHCHTKMNRI